MEDSSSKKAHLKKVNILKSFIHLFKIEKVSNCSISTGIVNSDMDNCILPKVVVEQCQIDFFYEKFKQV
jgi:hypothetical protein